jgi:hypothetical protein
MVAHLFGLLEVYVVTEVIEVRSHRSMKQQGGRQSFSTGFDFIVTHHIYVCQRCSTLLLEYRYA